MKSILITGGAGFIGSHLTDELLLNGYSVRILDNLSPQVHPTGQIPNYLSRDAEFVRGDVRDADAVAKAMVGIDAVVHFAASVGVGQSMYEVAKYTENNNVGTAVLLEHLINNPVERLLVASSMSIYGEGLYRAPDGRLVENAGRSRTQLQNGDWEVRDDATGDVLEPIPTTESKRPRLSSVYALSKYDQERTCLMLGEAYGIPAVALRFFNVYGPRQALSNPYTGVLAIFASRLLNEKPPLIYEDGEQRRDFVSVYDIARACRLALESPKAPGNVFNVGSGRSFTIREVADKLAVVMNSGQIPAVTGNYRVGDIRHCFADVSEAEKTLDYKPRELFETALEELAEWVEGQIALDLAEQAREELLTRGLAL